MSGWRKKVTPEENTPSGESNPSPSSHVVGSSIRAKATPWSKTASARKVRSTPCVNLRLPARTLGLTAEYSRGYSAFDITPGLGFSSASPRGPISAVCPFVLLSSPLILTILRFTIWPLILPLLGWGQKKREKPHNMRRPGVETLSFIGCVFQTSSQSEGDRLVGEGTFGTYYLSFVADECSSLSVGNIDPWPLFAIQYSITRWGLARLSWRTVYWSKYILRR
jgi:hypothetical protein